MLTLTVRPRLQRETWSLYWREAMATETACAPDVALPIGEAAAAGEGTGGGNDEAAPSPAPPPLAPTATVRDALRAAAAALKWPPVQQLVRLEGFEGPFERCIWNGVEVGLDEPAAKYAAAAVLAPADADASASAGAAAGATTSTTTAPPPLVYVRTVLAAEGWRLANDPANDPEGYSTSESDDSEDDA